MLNAIVFGFCLGNALNAGFREQWGLLAFQLVLAAIQLPFMFN